MRHSVLIVLCGAATIAAGQAIYVNDEAAFNTAAFERGLTFQVESFEDETAGPLLSGSYTQSTDLRVLYGSVNSGTILDGSSGVPPQPTDGSQTLYHDGIDTVWVTFIPPRPINAISFDLIDLIGTSLGGFDPEIASLTIRQAADNLQASWDISEVLVDTPGTVQTVGVIWNAPLSRVDFRIIKSVTPNSDPVQFDRVRFGSDRPVADLGRIANPNVELLADSFGSSTGTSIAIFDGNGQLVASNADSGPDGSADLSTTLAQAGTHWLCIAPDETEFSDGLGATGAIGSAQVAGEARGKLAGRRLPSLAMAPFAPVLYRFEATADTDVLLPSGPVPDVDLPISFASGDPVWISSDPGIVLAVFDAESRLPIAWGEATLEIPSLPDGSYVLAASAHPGGAGASAGLHIAPSNTSVLTSIEFVGVTGVNNIQFDPGVIEYFLFSVGSGAPVADLTTTGATLQGQTGFGEPDGTVNLDDLGFFLNFWLLGTP